ncbi:hypothetical protein D3C86_1751250 [compost metagenome]
MSASSSMPGTMAAIASRTLECALNCLKAMGELGSRRWPISPRIQLSGRTLSSRQMPPSLSRT